MAFYSPLVLLYPAEVHISVYRYIEMKQQARLESILQVGILEQVCDPAEPVLDWIRRRFFFSRILPDAQELAIEE